MDKCESEPTWSASACHGLHHGQCPNLLWYPRGQKGGLRPQSSMLVCHAWRWQSQSQVRPHTQFNFIRFFGKRNLTGVVYTTIVLRTFQQLSRIVKNQSHCLVSLRMFQEHLRVWKMQTNYNNAIVTRPGQLQWRDERWCCHQNWLFPGTHCSSDGSKEVAGRKGKGVRANCVRGEAVTEHGWAIQTPAKSTLLKGW